MKRIVELPIAPLETLQDFKHSYQVDQARWARLSMFFLLLALMVPCMLAAFYTGSNVHDLINHSLFLSLSAAITAPYISLRHFLNGKSVQRDIEDFHAMHQSHY